VTALFQAALGNLPVGGMIGFEPISRATRLLLARDLNAEIDSQSDLWRAADLQMQQLGFDEGVGQVDIEHVPDSHLHEGPHESLLQAPPSSFPNVSMMAYDLRQATSQFFDSMNTGDVTLFIETMVKAGPVPSSLESAFETIVHRRIQRTTEAIARVMAGDPSILGTCVPQVPMPLPRGGIGRQAWISNVQADGGLRYLWHGSRLQYTLQRVTN